MTNEKKWVKHSNVAIIQTSEYEQVSSAATTILNIIDKLAYHDDSRQVFGRETIDSLEIEAAKLINSRTTAFSKKADEVKLSPLNLAWFKRVEDLGKKLLDSLNTDEYDKTSKRDGGGPQSIGSDSDQLLLAFGEVHKAHGELRDILPAQTQIRSSEVGG